MLISKAEIAKMKDRYPDEKPIVFNYMQAREDFLRLADAYNTLANGSCGSTQGNPFCQPGENNFLVLIDSSFVRDAQILPADLFLNEETYFSEIDSKWEDYEASMMVGEYTGCCAEQAIMRAADDKDINPRKLIAYQIIG